MTKPKRTNGKNGQPKPAPAPEPSPAPAFGLSPQAQAEADKRKALIIRAEDEGLTLGLAIDKVSGGHLNFRQIASVAVSVVPSEALAFYRLALGPKPPKCFSFGLKPRPRAEVHKPSPEPEPWKPEPLTIQGAARMALAMQDGCNLSGLVHDFPRILEAIWAEARSIGEGTAFVNSHPIVTVVLQKLCDLAGLGIRDYAGILADMELVTKMARAPEPPSPKPSPSSGPAVVRL